ncbi:MAG TPA: tetratricopeptide repeat protein [Polyangia bacterium]|nr:tetratricopeptide repeat protein [Polyangia bacterium]
MSTSMRRSRFAFVALTVAACLLAPPPRGARAAKDQAAKDPAAAKAAAKTVLARGARDLDARLYGRALAQFNEAYKIFPSPKIFFNIGLANLYLGHLGEALQAFEAFLAEPSDAPDESVARAKAEREALRPKVAAVTVACAQPDVEVIIDGRAVGNTPLKHPVFLDPGLHQLQAKPRVGAPIAREFSVDAGTRPTLDLPLAATPAAPASSGGKGGAPAATRPSPAPPTRGATR